MRALRSVGVTDAHAKTTADVLVTTDTWGVHTHGTKLLPGYLNRLKGGGLRTDTEPVVVSAGPSWTIVDGGSILGQVTSKFAMDLAIAKAQTTGVAYTGVRNSCHFGAAGYYAWYAARKGLFAMATANDIPGVAAPGSRGAVVGTNPIAYGMPAHDRDPIVLDMAISHVAGGKVKQAFERGESIPDHWLIDTDGHPTDDASLFPRSATLTPMCAHKGYGLGLLAECLAGVIPGAGVLSGVAGWLNHDPSQPTNHGAAFLAIDVSRLMPPEEAGKRVDAMIAEIAQAPLAEGTDRLYVPGEIEANKRRRALAEGIPLPREVRETLARMAADYNLTADWLREG